MFQPLLFPLVGLFAGCLGGAKDAAVPIDADGDRYASAVDCDDQDATIHPEATEVCDGVDNDCDGVIDGDNAVDAVPWYGDADGDGWGNPDVWTLACEAPPGWVGTAGDCDDDASANMPGGVEICDGLDNDCDGAVDEGDAVDATLWYDDLDGDGFGNPFGSVVGCEAPEGWVAVAGDCDDTDPNISEGSAEVCDDANTDEDCDGRANDYDPDAQGTFAVWQDNDGDSHGDPDREATACTLPNGWAAVGDDCDDTDPARYPGSAEICGDGLDNDCDDLIDDGGVALLWYTDADGDGWGDPSANLGLTCADPGGASPWPSDCDDTDAAVSPDAAEIWYDGIDQNCDGGADGDADGDGVTALVVGGLDCDDSDAAIFPGAPEICGDGADNDCDGVTDPCASPLSWTSADPTDRTGAALAWAGDAVLLGAPRADSPEPGAGAVALLRRVGDTWSTAALWTGEAGWDAAGSAVLDLGDGFAIGAPGAADAGAITLLAADEGSGDLGALGTRITGVTAGDQAGSTLSGAGDVDSDGAQDLWIGGPGADGGAGAAWLLRRAEADRGSDLSWAALALVGADAGDAAGSALAGDLDLDGDGVSDALIGAPGAGGSATGGAVYAWLAPGAGTGDLADADLVWHGSSAGDAAGAALASLGDADGDGRDDWIVGAPDADVDGSSAGRAWVVPGGAASGSLASVALLSLCGSSPDDRLGAAVAGLGDVSGDGLNDAAVGVPGWDGASSGQGAAWVVSALDAGTASLGASGGWLMEGVGAGAGAGSALAGGGDSDGDGKAELVIGAPGAAAVSFSVW